MVEWIRFAFGSLTTSTILSGVEGWWSWPGSNRRPLECDSSALPAELQPPNENMIEESAISLVSNEKSGDSGLIRTATYVRFAP